MSVVTRRVPVRDVPPPSHTGQRPHAQPRRATHAGPAAPPAPRVVRVSSLRTGARSRAARPRAAHTRGSRTLVEDARPSARLSTTAFDLRRYTRRAFHGRRYWRSMIVDYSDAHERPCTRTPHVGRRPRRCEFERRTKTSRNDPISDCDTQRCKSGPAVRLRYATMAVTAHARTAHAVRAGIGARKNNGSSGDEASGRCWGRNVEQRI